MTIVGGLNVTKHNCYGNKGTLSWVCKLEPLYIKNGVHLAKFLSSHASEASREVENFFKRKNTNPLGYCVKDVFSKYATAHQYILFLMLYLY